MQMRLTVFVAMVSMACLFAPRVCAAPNDAAEVQSFVGGFATDWNRHDMVAFGKLFAMDADFINVAGFWMKGRNDIQMHHAYSHGTIPSSDHIAGAHRKNYAIFKNTTMRFNSIDVRFPGKDVAIAHVRWELFGDARTTIPRRGILVFVLARQGSGWQIVTAQNTEINRTVK